VSVTACAKKAAPLPPVPAAPAPPPPPQNIFALLPDPEGKNSRIVVKNSAGEQEISQPNQAVRVAGQTTPPTSPFPIDQATVRRLFGSALDALPGAEVHFTLHFDAAQDVLNATSQAQFPAILRSIQERHSTDISITGHTDTTGDPAANYQLGLRRAEGVADLLRAQGLDSSSLFVTSHGEADPLVKTGRGVAEPLNRRVEVIVR
jgi:outer membrane protein OmpA-like peptidoglycan-associated protein